MELFPNAPVFTLVYDQERLGVEIDTRRLKTSFLQRLPGARSYHRYFPLLMPLAVEQFDLSEFDVVLSASHSFGKGIIIGPNTLHISYCFTPTRYLWDNSHQYVREFSRSRIFQQFVPMALSYVRLWDFYASKRVDSYVTLSQYVAQRIRKYYGRSAEVVAPPVDIERFSTTDDGGDYYVVVSRLLPYKRVDLAIEACEQINRPLKVVGVGPELKDLRRRAAKKTEFLGFVSDDRLPEIYAGAKALLFPQEEDFGITPLEAAASGKPTIAYRAGGALETVIEGKTGLFFDRQDTDSLAQAILEFEERDWDPLPIRQHASGFSKARFLRQMENIVHNQWMEFSRKYEFRARR